MIFLPYYRITWTTHNMLTHSATCINAQNTINLIMYLEDECETAFDIEYALFTK